MKRLLTILILIFTLQTPSQADDIRDFQIEGMSIGNNLLDYMTEDEINNSKRNYTKNKRYYVVGYDKNLNVYDSVDIYLKSADKNYEIRALTGQLHIKGKKCLSKKKEITNELKELFKNTKEVSYDNNSHSFDKTGKSKQYQSAYLFKNDENKDHIRIECTFWSKDIKKKHNFFDHLNVAAINTEILRWFSGGYK